MRNEPDLEVDEYLAAVATARVVLGPSIRLQAPPNLVDLDDCVRLLDAGVDDWGGISPLTPDHVNPERPWPQIEQLRLVLKEHDFELRERLTAHPHYVRDETPWLDPRILPHVRALAGPDGLADENALRPRDGRGRSPIRSGSPAGASTCTPRSTPRGAPTTAARTSTTSTATGPRWPTGSTPAPRIASLSSDVAAALRQAERNAMELTEAQGLALMTADGADLAAVAKLADEMRRDTVGDDITYVVNRNINFTNVCYTGCRFCAFAQRATDADAYTLSVGDIETRVREAAAEGATEICMQGGIDPNLPRTAYFDLARAVKNGGPGHPPARVQPDGGHQRCVPGRHVDRGVADRGARGRPGLDPRHRRRDPRRRRPLGAHQGQAADQRLDRGRHHRAPPRHPVDVHDDVRPRRPARSLGPPHPAASAGCRTRPAASPSSSRCRSSTRRRRSISPASPVRARRSATTSPCTRSPGSCCTVASATSRPAG